MNDRRTFVDTARVARAARLIHAAVVGGVLAAFAVFLYLGARVAPELPDTTARSLKFIGYVLLVVPVLGSGVARGRIAPHQRELERGEWWAANLPKAVIVWALAELGGLGAIVLGWLGGDTTLIALGAAVSLAVLFVSRPGRLEERS